MIFFGDKLLKILNWWYNIMILIKTNGQIFKLTNILLD